MSLAVRRILAFGVDWLILSVYGACWFLVMVMIYGSEQLREMAQSHDPIRGQILGFFTLTLVFALYFASRESSRTQATVGKQILRLSVVTAEGERVGFARTLARAAVKFLPWEVAHVFTNHLYAHAIQTPDEPEPAWLWVLCAVSMSGAILYALTLFFGTGTTPYDRLTGTRVTSA